MISLVTSRHSTSQFITVRHSASRDESDFKWKTISNCLPRKSFWKMFWCWSFAFAFPLDQPTRLTSLIKWIFWSQFCIQVQVDHENLFQKLSEKNIFQSLEIFSVWWTKTWEESEKQSWEGRVEQHNTVVSILAFRPSCPGFDSQHFWIFFLRKKLSKLLSLINDAG